MSAEIFMEKLLDGAEVEWMPLGEVTKIKHGKDWKKLKAGKIPVYGSGGIMGHVDTFSYNKPTVLIPRKGSITNIFYVDTPFWNVDTIYYTEMDDAAILPKYLYYFICTIDLMTLDTGSGRPSLTQAILNKILIPIPCPDDPEKSLRIQREIVRILDAFTELTSRKKQYNYYRDQLLTFEEGDGEEASHEDTKTRRKVEWKTLGEVAESVASGRNKNRSDEGIFPVYGSTGRIGFTNEPVYSGNYLLVARVGAYAGLVNAVTGDFDVSDNTLVICLTDAWDFRFAYHQLTHLNLNQFAVGAGQPLVTGGLLKSLKIPLPPINEQKRIANILDKFDALTNSISEGLPREIELRQKQYEYYRDLLFNFPACAEASAGRPKPEVRD